MFDLAQLSCLGPDHEGVWRYLPRRADIRRDTRGVPQVTRTELDGTTFLMFTATWAAPISAVEALREEIAARIGEPVVARLRLAFAPVEQPTCRVLAAGADGSVNEVDR